MNAQPLVSIIIPTYNRAHLIGETLDSVLAQSYQNWECIIVDDCSSDNTDKVVDVYLKKDSRFKYYHRPDDYAKGANSCRHIGFLNSTGDYINWFDSDDLMLQDHLSLKVNFISKAKYDFVACEVYRWYQDVENPQKLKIKNNYIINPIVGQFIGELTLFTCGPMWDRDFLVKNELFYKQNKNDRSDTILNDWTFGLEALFITTNFFFIEKPLILYRFHKDSIYRDRLKAKPEKFLNEFELRKKYYYKSKKKLGENSKIEKFYLERNLKILRNLIVKRYAAKHIIIEVLKLKCINSSEKLNLLFYYFTAVVFRIGVNKLRLK